MFDRFLGGPRGAPIRRALQYKNWFSGLNLSFVGMVYSNGHARPSERGYVDVQLDPTEFEVPKQNTGRRELFQNGLEEAGSR